MIPNLHKQIILILYEAWIHASVFAPRQARINIRTSMQIFTTHFLSQWNQFLYLWTVWV